ncbi:MAG: ABC transporter permease [Lachnospiraceae bacterium]|nr:ABC transporter permease [Lachnospiraceae bacterium]
MNKKMLYRCGLEKLGDASSLLTVAGALLILIVFFAIGTPYFLSGKNFLNIGLYAAIVGCISCSVTFINISGMIDLSVGSQIAVVGMVAAIVSRMGTPWYLVCLVALAAGVLCGFINGFFITVFKLNAFITTIATMQTLRGFAFLLSDGQSLPISDGAFKFIGRGYLLGIPVSLLIMVASYLIFHVISKYTVFGRNVYLIGGNAQASYLAGIKVNRMRMNLYLLNGFMAGVAGILLAAQTGSGMPNAAATYNMTALSAVILGGVALTGGKGTIFGTFLGCMVLSVLQNGMTMMSVGTYWQDIIIGFVLIFSVSVDAVKGGSLKRKL